MYFFPQIEPHTGPAIIIATVPHAIPTSITHPKSTLSIVATSTGPGVGGINACPTASPAKEVSHRTVWNALFSLQARMQVVSG